jgi:hypothetical protein
MKALSIKQPWASLIAHGIKNIENRTWKTKFRGRIFIHASAKSVQIHKYLSEEQLNVLRNRKEPWDITHLSAIIGEVDIIDCVVNHHSIWAEKTAGRYVGDGVFVLSEKPIYNWVLSNAVLYDKPILNVKGKLSFWETDYCHCEVCQKPFHSEAMVLSEDNWICEECLNEELSQIAEL